MRGSFAKYRLKRPFGLVLVVAVWVAGVFAAVPSWAGAPEYMKLKPAVGQPLEIEGVWDDAGVFIADDIERLPQPRKLKLRGTIQAVDAELQTITMYGRAIYFGEQVQFIRDGGTTGEFSQLKPGQRLEVSCKVDDAGRWEARRVKTHGVKSSDKVKGTVTRVAVDGTAPDTLEIDGLLILLVRETDVVDTEGAIHELEKELFPDVQFGRLDTQSGGWLLGDAVLVQPDYRQTLSKKSEYDLTASAETDESRYEHDLRLEANADLGADMAGYLQVRMRHQISLQDQADRGTPPTLIRPTQLYVVVRIPGAPGTAVQIGRQDFDEPREWLFDEYQDAVRLYYYGAAPWVFEAAYIDAVDPIKTKFETWTDLFAQVRWYQNADAFAAAYYWKRADSDVRNREPVWYGVRYYGDATPSIRPWADLSFVRGEDKGDDLEGWAFDVGATYTVRHNRYRPRFTVSYAAASGDDPATGTTNETFRQTGYEDNVASFGGHAGFQYYGSVLDPELSNLKIWTVGIGVAPIRHGSVDVVYHQYKQHTLINEMTGSDLFDPPARPDGTSDDIGWGLDLVFGFPQLWQHVNAKWILGYFNPGKAFDPRQKNALINKINIKIGL